MFSSRYLNKKIHVQCFRRLCKIRAANYTISHLKDRSLLHVYGKDSQKLLQGLITNDINILTEQPRQALYSMLLNARGRCEYDVMMYPYIVDNMNGYLIECDRSQSENLLQLIKMYKLRSKVKFGILETENVHAIFGENLSHLSYSDDTLLFNDNRVENFGARLISNQPLNDIASNLNCEIASEEEYQIHRYKNGLSEGESETSNCIPLEHNVALINGISFTKGCYIGQELMAKTNFTGVIRKRVTPIHFDNNEHNMNVGSTIRNNKNKRAGKIIGIQDRFGIALVRLNEFFTGTDFISQNEKGEETSVNISRPTWWPDDLEY